MNISTIKEILNTSINPLFKNNGDYYMIRLDKIEELKKEKEEEAIRILKYYYNILNINSLIVSIDSFKDHDESMQVYYNFNVAINKPSFIPLQNRTIFQENFSFCVSVQLKKGEYFNLREETEE